MPTVQVAFRCDGPDVGLHDLRFTLQRLINQVAAALRQPEPLESHELERLIAALEPTLPMGAASGLMLAAGAYRHTKHAGVRGSSVPLPAALLEVNIADERARIWTPRGWITVKLLPGNYQRHLLRRGEPVNGERLLLTKRGWALRMSYPQEPSGGFAFTPPQFTALPSTERHSLSARLKQAAELEREGDFAALQHLLAHDPADALSRARLALCELLVGDMDMAELSLMRLSGQAQVDARVALGLSILAGRRSDPERRLTEARRGLAGRPDTWTRPWLLCSAGRALVELGDAPQALTLIQQALSVIEPADLRGRARALYFLQGTYGALEDFAGQERVAREALRLFELLGIQEERLSILMDLAYRRFLGNDPVEAQHLINRAVGTLETLSDPRLPSALLVRAEIALLEERFEAAQFDLMRALELEQSWHQDRLATVLRAYLLECRWRLGQLDASAFSVAVTGLQEISNFDRTVVQFYRGLALWLTGHPERARLCFHHVMDGVALLDSFRLRAAAFVLDVDRQAGQLRRDSPAPLLDLLERIGGDLVLELDAELLAPLYQELSAMNLDRRLTRLTPTISTDRTLHLTTLGEFKLQIGGEGVALGLSKGRELLVWLALHGEGSRAALQDALWDGDRRTGVGSYFKQAVRAVREALLPFLPKGHQAVVFEHGRYRLSAALVIDLDAAPFLNTAVPARELENALDRYGGPFLDHADSDWVVATREQIRATAHDACMELARTAQPIDAPDFYRKAITLDPLSEETWASLIRAWERVGDDGQVRRTKLAQRLTFQNELGET